MPATKRKKKAVPKKLITRKGDVVDQSIKYPAGKNGNCLSPSPKQFTADHQPTKEQRIAGQRKRYALKALLDLAMKGKFKNSTEDYAMQVAKFYGIERDLVTVDMIMDFRQIEKAILKGDTSAYNAVKDRAHGKPKQAIELIPDMTIKINGKVVGSKPNQ